MAPLLDLCQYFFWSERSACDQRSNLGRPLFLVLIGPSVLRAPAEQTKLATVFGPSVAVQAVSRSDDGTTIIIDFFSFLFLSFLFLSFFLSTAIVKIPEGVVVLFQIFACGPELPIE